MVKVMSTWISDVFFFQYTNSELSNILKLTQSMDQQNYDSWNPHIFGKK